MQLDQVTSAPRATRVSMRTAVWMAIKALDNGGKAPPPSKLTHVKTSSNAGTLQWLLSVVLGARGHQTRHLVLSQVDLAAAEGGEAEVGDLELVGGSRHCEVLVVVMVVMRRKGGLRRREGRVRGE